MAMKADRYTCIRTHLNDIPARLAAIDSLNMHWFIIRPENGYVDEKITDIYVFFDQSGLDNYLSGIYGDSIDAIRHILEKHTAGEVGTDETLIEILKLLDF